MSKIKKSKGVFFAFVEIIEYDIVLGDHPSVSSGPPISLGWDVESNEMFTVDMYESIRDRRPRHELIVPASVRVSTNNNIIKASCFRTS
jgi:hypothetical protein